MQRCNFNRCEFKRDNSPHKMFSVFYAQMYENIIYIELMCKYIQLQISLHVLIFQRMLLPFRLSSIIIQLPTGSRRIHTQHIIQLDVKMIFDGSECRPRSKAIETCWPRV